MIVDAESTEPVGTKHVVGARPHALLQFHSLKLRKKINSSLPALQVRALLLLHQILVGWAPRGWSGTANMNSLIAMLYHTQKHTHSCWF
jgi:hypothetical protein